MLAWRWRWRNVVDGGAQEELLKSGRRSSYVDGSAHEELVKGGKLQTRSSNVDAPPWGEFELEFKLE